jgi:hypothetical protein
MPLGLAGQYAVDVGSVHCMSASLYLIRQDNEGQSVHVIRKQWRKTLEGRTKVSQRLAFLPAIVSLKLTAK